jgi:hypothetical protein
MAVTGSATNGSVRGSAVGSVLDPVDLVNVPVADPAAEKYPGAVDPQVYLDPGVPLSAAGPLDVGAEPFASSLPPQVQGGGYQDTTWVLGNEGNAPGNPWDSNAGPPFAPSGAANPEIHDDDGTGATFAAQYVVGANFGQLTRATRDGETYNREYVFEPVNGMNVPAPNGRSDHDQYQYHDPDPVNGGGYSPGNIPYAERPIMNNLAYEAMPILPTDSAYTPSGQLPDRSQYNSYQAQAYEAPQDPYVGVVTPQSQSGMGNGLDFGLVS